MKSSQKGWVSRALTGNEEWQVGLLLLFYIQIFKMGGRVEKSLAGNYLLKKFVTNFDLAVELSCGIFGLKSYLV